MKLYRTLQCLVLPILLVLSPVLLPGWQDDRMRISTVAGRGHCSVRSSVCVLVLLDIIQIWANVECVFGKNLPFPAFFSTVSSLLRPCASSRPHHGWEAYVSLAMKVAQVTSHNKGTVGPRCLNVLSYTVCIGPYTTNRSTFRVNEKVHWNVIPIMFILSTRSMPLGAEDVSVLVLGRLVGNHYFRFKSFRHIQNKTIVILV